MHEINSRLVGGGFAVGTVFAIAFAAADPICFKWNIAL